MNTRIFDSVESLSEEAAVRIVKAVAAAEAPFHLVLGGGSTPRKLYGILASPAFKEAMPWNRIHCWWGDERFVPPTEMASNERMAREALVDLVRVPEDNVHPMYRFGTAEEAATAYEEKIRELVPGGVFDLVLLGLGPDAHTASLFPGDPSVHEKKRWVVTSAGAAGVKERLTLTAPILNRAKEVMFLVAGSDKAEPLAKVMGDEYDPDRYPAQIVARNAPNVEWYIDTEAAALL